MDELEWKGENLGKEVGTYLVAYLEDYFFLWEDEWLDGDL